ncbi:MAG TPA: Gp138 family membrane-puncturing spike protein [Bryobacteraceae bacterium]|nr:Gp138 family membrane-puncturing spike protein [Bryobacteraceae bacterium]
MSSNFGVSLEQRLTPSIATAQRLADSISQSMRVAIPAVVQSFSPGPPATVSVVVAINEFVMQDSGDDSTVSLETRAVQLPVLEDVPVMVPSAGGWSLTFPIQPGDECLIVFGDASLDSWLESGGANNYPVSQRRHSLSDGVAIFGLRSKPRGLSGYPTESAQLRNDDGTVKIDLAPDTITITAPTVNVNAESVTVDASETVKIEGDSQVLISNGTKTRDFFSHQHSGVAGGVANSGPVF